MPSGAAVTRPRAQRLRPLVRPMDRRPAVARLHRRRAADRRIRGRPSRRTRALRPRVSRCRAGSPPGLRPLGPRVRGNAPPVEGLAGVDDRAPRVAAVPRAAPGQGPRPPVADDPAPGQGPRPPVAARLADHPAPVPVPRAAVEAGTPGLPRRLRPISPLAQHRWAVRLPPVPRADRVRGPCRQAEALPGDRPAQRRTAPIRGPQQGRSGPHRAAPCAT